MRTFLVGVMLALPATTLLGQSRGEPNLILTIYGGASSGHALWDIPRQTLLYHSSSSNPPDTVALSRRVNSSIVAGVVATLFQSTHFGSSLEVAFRTLSFDDSCGPVAPFQVQGRPDSLTRQNEVLCNNINASANSGSVLSLVLGGTVRAASRGSISPYIRGAVAVSNNTLSTVALAEVQPRDSTRFPESRAIIVDDSPRRYSVGLQAGAGITAALGPGYRFRLEVRDDMISFERNDGAVNAIGIGERSTKFFHHIGLVLGLDIILEQKRVRRY
jgi:hypothetical protein